MLVILRKFGESIYIGDGIRIIVLGKRGSKRIRLGVLAPKEVAVRRSEIYERLPEEELKF